MSDWKECRLGDIIKIKSGLPYKGEFLNKGSNYLLGMGCVSFSETFLMNGARHYSDDGKHQYLGKSGDIVLATRQQSDNLPILGMPAFIPDCFGEGKVIVGSNLYMVENNSDVDNQFIFWLLRTPKYINHIKNSQTGTTVRMITKKDIENFSFLLPPKNQREAISSLLWNIQDKIETNRRINARLEELAQALFKSWLESCNTTAKIGELANNILDYTPNINAKIRLINSADVTEGIFEDYPLVDNKNLKGHFKKRFQKEDILYSEIRPRNHHYGYALFDGDDYIISTRLMVIRNRPEKVTSAILYQYLLLPEVEADFTAKTESRSGTFPQGTYKDLESISVPYSENQKKINAILMSIRQQIQSHTIESARLAALRDALLPKLMSGELKPV